MLDKSVNWDRMSRGVKWPKMTLTYSDGSVEHTKGTTYQYEHGLRRNGRRPVKIELNENSVDSDTLDHLRNSLAVNGDLVINSGRTIAVESI